MMTQVNNTFRFLNIKDPEYEDVLSSFINMNIIRNTRM